MLQSITTEEADYSRPPSDSTIKLVKRLNTLLKECSNLLDQLLSNNTATEAQYKDVCTYFLLGFVKLQGESLAEQENPVEALSSAQQVMQQLVMQELCIRKVVDVPPVDDLQE